jgi:soluble lytic murein transglycosylase-like protein
MPAVGLTQSLIDRRRRHGGSATSDASLSNYAAPASPAPVSSTSGYTGTSGYVPPASSGYSVPATVPLANAITPQRLQALLPKILQQNQNGLSAQKPQPRVQVPSYVPPQYRSDVAQAARRSGIPATVLAAQLQQESGFDPNAGSPAGAQGIAQFMPGTAATAGPHGTPLNTSDPHASIQAQGRLMGQLRQQFGSTKLALAAYNAGPGAVQEAGNRVPAIPETQDYVSTILGQARSSGGTTKVPVRGGSQRTSGGPYVDPFGGSIQIGRTDMGIDPYGPGPIRAIGRAKYLGTGGSGWPTEGGSGTGPVYKLLQGPQQGKRVYTYEGITPRSDLQPGDILHKGETIARSTGDDFETGFAQGRSVGFQPLAAPHYSEGDVTPEGTAFRKFVDSVQGKRGSYPTAGAAFSGAATPSTNGSISSVGTGGTAPVSSPAAASRPRASLSDILSSVAPPLQSQLSQIPLAPRTDLPGPLQSQLSQSPLAPRTNLRVPLDQQSQQDQTDPTQALYDLLYGGAGY